MLTRGSQSYVSARIACQGLQACASLRVLSLVDNTFADLIPLGMLSCDMFFRAYCIAFSVCYCTGTYLRDNPPLEALLLSRTFARASYTFEAFPFTPCHNHLSLVFAEPCVDAGYF